MMAGEAVYLASGAVSIIMAGAAFSNTCFELLTNCQFMQFSSEMLIYSSDW